MVCRYLLAEIYNQAELDLARQLREQGDPRFAPTDPNDAFNEVIDDTQGWIDGIGFIPVAGDILGDGTNATPLLVKTSSPADSSSALTNSCLVSLQKG